LNIIDSHAHLDMPEFDSDREQVIARANDAGVNKIVTIGIDLKSSLESIILAARYPSVWAAVGVHPQESKGVQKEDIDRLVEMAGHLKVVAIGELGLDFHHEHSPRETQFSVLQWELEVAKRTGLPVIIHCRQAQAEMLPVLKSWSDSYKLPADKPRGVVHCFSGDIQTAEKYLEMGFYISLGAYIGYPSSKKFRETIISLPPDRLMLETDSPFLPPQKFRGQRNEPSYTVITLGVLAEIKQVSIEEVARQTTLNTMKVFNLPE
jgi:TatD DNase family protein